MTCQECLKMCNKVVCTSLLSENHLFLLGLWIRITLQVEFYENKLNENTLLTKLR